MSEIKKADFKKFCTATILCAITLFSGAQHRISGYIEDKSTSEKLFGATVVIEGTSQGAVSNFHGYYSLEVPSEVVLVYSFVGYEPIKKAIHLSGDSTLTIGLSSSVVLDEVVIEGNKDERIELTPQVSTVKISGKQLMNLPAIGGEVDVLKAIQLMPGVQSGKEGLTGIYVRGGGPDQNLILLDGVPLYNVSHLGGLFSVFNPDVISDVTLMKGGFPARYGGRLSSVINIKVKDGNKVNNTTEGTVGLISARVMNQGPIAGGRGSYLIGARRTYIDLLTRPLSKSASDGKSSFGYHFHDINAKLSYEVTDKDKIQLSIYQGDDRGLAKLKDTVDNSRSIFAWGNLLTTARWNHLFSDKVFTSLMVNYSKYRFKLDYEYENTREQENESFEYKSGIEDIGVSYEVEYYMNNNHNFLGGIQFINHFFTPGVNRIKTNLEGSEMETTFGSFDIRSTEFSGYVEDQWSLGSLVKFNLGLHYNNYQIEGDYFHSVQPRATARILTSDNSSLKFSYASMQQNVHLLTSSGAGLPTDIWVPATDIAKPQSSQQVTIAYTRTLDFVGADLTIEAYKKEMSNLIAYAEGENWEESAADWQDKVESDGRGDSKGLEILLHRKEGRFNGWLGYTISKSDRQFSSVNFGRTFPYKYDRRHDVGLLASYEINDRTDISMAWVYGTGNAITLGEARYVAVLPGQVTPQDIGFFWGPSMGFGPAGEAEHYNGRNGFRMRSYHRADLGVRFKKQKKNGQRIWNIGIYNVYNRANPFYYYFDETYDFNTNETKRKLKQVTLFPIIPTFSYTYKFN